MVAKTAPAKALPKAKAPSAPAEGVAEEASPTPFSWTPKAGGPVIVLPAAATAVPRGRALSFFYQMNKRKGDFIDQAVYALTSAGVTNEALDHIFETLDDEELMELVNAWASEITGASPGES